MRQNDLLDWYESDLPVRERKLKGHFSTPPHLIAQILDACGYTPEHDLAAIRVLDPACGSGNFVAGAAQRLIAYGKRANLSSPAIAELVRRNIWGFDPDPVACFLAEMQLRHAFAEQAAPATMADTTPEVLTNKQRHGAKRDGDPGRVQIHQADGLTFPWPQGGQVDLLLANPPYLAAKNNDLSVYRFAQQRGQADSYLLFLELALQIVRPGGWLGLVLPDPVLARSNAVHERRRLLAETTVHHLWHLADVFTAYVGAVVIVAQKRPPEAMHSIAWRRSRWQQSNSTRIYLAEKARAETAVSSSGRVSQALLQQQAGAELRYLLSELQGTLVEQIYTHVQNGDISSAKGGTYGLGKLFQIHRGEELSKESPLLQRHLPLIHEERFYPVLRGGSDVRPYGIPGTQYWIQQDKIVKPLERYLIPKILVVKSAGRLQACLDLQGHVVLQTLYTLSLAPHPSGQALAEESRSDSKDEYLSLHGGEQMFSMQDELYYLLAILNSRLLQRYVYVLHTAYKWVQPQIEQRVLAQLPLPTRPDLHEKGQIIRRARQIMHACSPPFSDVELKERRQAWYEDQERAICRLYQAAIQERRFVQRALKSESSLDVPDKGVIEYG